MSRFGHLTGEEGKKKGGGGGWGGGGRSEKGLLALSLLPQSWSEKKERMGNLCVLLENFSLLSKVSLVYANRDNVQHRIVEGRSIFAVFMRLNREV